MKAWAPTTTPLGGPWPRCSQQDFVLLVLAMTSLPQVCSGLLLYHCDWWSLSVTNKGISVTFWSWKTAKTRQFWFRNLPLPVAPSNNEKQNGGLITWRQVKGKVPSLPGSQSTYVNPWSGWSLGTNDVFGPLFRDERRIDQEKSEKISASEKATDSSGRACAIRVLRCEENYISNAGIHGTPTSCLLTLTLTGLQASPGVH